MAYKDFIESMKQKWIGKKVSFEGQEYTVIYVDYNGALMINRPTFYCESYTSTTTAVGTWQLDK